MNGRILAMGVGDVLSRASKLGDLPLETSEKPRPRIALFLDAFRSRECDGLGS